MPVNAASFTEAIRCARLLDAAQLEQFARELQPRFSEPRAWPVNSFAATG